MVIAEIASRDVAFNAAKIGETVFTGQSEIQTGEIATVDQFPPTRRFWKTLDAPMRIHIFLIRTIQIANESMTSGANDNYTLNRAQTRIMFSRLVLSLD